MVHKAHRSSISFGRSEAAAKNWVIGWTTDEARHSIQQRSQPEIKRPGAYGLLVNSGRR